MFPLWRVAYVRAAVQQAPWHSVALGLASWIVVVGAPAVFVGIVLTIESVAAAKGFAITLWAVLVVGVLLVAGGLWAWRVSGLVDKEVRARHHGLREVESERLLVRRPVPQDAVALAATIDAEMIAGNGWTEREARTMVKSVRSGHPVAGLFVFESRSDRALVGGATVHPSDNDPSSRTLGWWIGPRHRRAGYASEAVAALVEAIHDAGFATVEIGTSESNLAVRRICDKIGATEKYRRAQRLPNGSLVPSIWYEHRQVVTDEPSVSPAG
nr:GNAT family N-acetyltransferase [Nocardia sp. GTS18]